MLVLSACRPLRLANIYAPIHHESLKFINLSDKSCMFHLEVLSSVSEINTMRYHFTLKSSNAKTGPIPVSTTSSDSCPRTCGQYKTCYAKGGPLAIHWRALDSGTRGISLEQFTDAIRALPAGQLWRHNQAGDLPGTDSKIDTQALNAIVRANTGRKGFTYTHKPMTAANARVVKSANARDFTINLSADTVRDADQLHARKIGPVVVVVPAETRENFKTPAGNQAVICPAVTHNVSCADCKLCAWNERKVIIAFPAHGAKAKQVKSDLVQIGQMGA